MASTDCATTGLAARRDAAVDALAKGPATAVRAALCPPVLSAARVAPGLDDLLDGGAVFTAFLAQRKRHAATRNGLADDAKSQNLALAATMYGLRRSIGSTGICILTGAERRRN